MDALDFGKFLSQQRELRGMSRETVASATKIPLAQISALESGDLSKLPSRLYVLNFIRSYASVIGLSPEDAILRYDELTGAGLASADEQGASSLGPGVGSPTGSPAAASAAAAFAPRPGQAKMPKVLLKADRSSGGSRIERILFICLLLALVLGGYVLAVRFGKAPSPFRH